ncbi:MAG: Tex-like N-terminal domain-containing protein, partial [Planctomycetota bacterium]|nr:Tex-like N-terminal domain-containing protein [Planctomycetota bacterium]
MQNKHVSVIAAEQGVHPRLGAATAKLLGGCATVPFSARYRKEATGSLDETIILGIRDRLDQLHALDQRRETILKSLKEQGNLSDELRNQIQDADTLAALEDLYLPY